VRAFRITRLKVLVLCLDDNKVCTLVLHSSRLYEILPYLEVWDSKEAHHFSAARWFTYCICMLAIFGLRVRTVTEDKLLTSSVVRNALLNLEGYKQSNCRSTNRNLSMLTLLKRSYIITIRPTKFEVRHLNKQNGSAFAV
jgi:hypothetical protein